jgi:hypothetical protein
MGHPPPILCPGSEGAVTGLTPSGRSGRVGGKKGLVALRGVSGRVPASTP